MPTKKVAVYITKHALTVGILRVDADVDVDSGDAWVPVLGRTYPELIRSIDVHNSILAARTRAHELRHQKIRSLQRQVLRLESLVIKES